jgi:hypothetical protein
MAQATKPTSSPISQNKIILPPKLSEPKTQLEYTGTSIKKSLNKTLKFMVKKFDVLSPTVDDLKHPINIREPNSTTVGPTEPSIPQVVSTAVPAPPPTPPPNPTDLQSEIKLDSPTSSPPDKVPEIAPEQIVKTPSPATIDLIVLPPLSQTENQASNEPPPPTYLHPTQGSAPPPNELTAIPSPFSGSTAPKYNGGSNSQSVSKMKLFGYFLLGFLLNFLFLIPTVLWLALKSKVGTKQKFVAYLVGFVSSLVIGAFFNGILSQFIGQKLTETIPSLAYVPQTISTVYPDLEASASVYYEKEFTNGAEISTSTLTVNIASQEPLDSNMYKQIGILACDALANRNESFDRVAVSQIGKKKVFIFTIDTFATIDQTCFEWYGGPPPMLPDSSILE